MWRAEAPVLTVNADRDDVERRLGAGMLACPARGGLLAGWGQTRERMVRGRDGMRRLAPRQARCHGCARTHVLLPVTCLSRRADEAVVIGWGAGGEDGRGRAPGDRRGAGLAGLDGAGVAAGDSRPNFQSTLQTTSWAALAAPRQRNKLLSSSYDIAASRAL